MVAVEEVRATSGHALVRVERSGHAAAHAHLEGRLIVPEGRWEINTGFEVAQVLSLGDDVALALDLEPGDRVLVQAKLGGVAGSDVSSALAAPRGTFVIVTRDEILCGVE